MISLATNKVRRQTGLHHPVSVYAKQVTQGKLHDMCCPDEISACQRHLDDLKAQLKAAIANEDYESAAKLRDEIRSLEAEGGGRL